MTTCTRRIQFCAGHRLMGHEGKCAHLHGHNYVALITAAAPGLDQVGRVIDFAVIKERVGGWIEQQWDHGVIYNAADQEVARALDCIPNQKRFALNGNPTAENLAEYLLRVACPSVLRDTGVRVTKVTLWETENCYAEVTA